MTRFTAPPDILTSETTPVPRSQATRGLHLMLLLAVAHQLLNSQFIERPVPGETSSLLYDLHQYVGLASLGIVGAFWIWTMVRQGETRLGRLLPWSSAERMRDVLADLAAQGGRLLRRQAPSDEDGALASAVHGLGLLVLTAMVLTGTVYYFAIGAPVAHTALSAHKLMANLMWGYLILHAGLAVLHRLLGSNIFSRMFWPSRPSRVTT